MEIAARLRLNTWFSLAVVMCMMLSLAWSFREIDRTDGNENLVEEMRKAAFQRISLRDDYLLHREERARIQWYTKSETLRGLLDTASERFTKTEDKALLQEARKDFDATFSSFSTIVEKHKQGERRVSGKFAFDEAESRLIGQVFLKSYALIDSISRLYESTERTAKAARNRGVALIIFFIVGGTIAVVINSASLNRIVAKRLAALHEGVGIIGSGNLDYRIKMEGDDELSALARASNEMAAGLKKSHTSVENLQGEITARREAEEALRVLNASLEQRVLDRTAQLKTSNRELEAFAYSVSHDLRAPLRAIEGFSHIIMTEYAHKLDAEGNRLLNIISSNTRTMDLLINDLLTLSRVVRGEMKSTAIHMTVLVRSVYDEIASPAVKKGFAFSLGQLPDAYGDAVLLRQVWTNLLDNAIKYTMPKDERKIEISGHIEKGMSIYSIKDTGVGFDPAYIHKLFGVFQRLHSTKEFEGTGVGLAIVQRIVERHGGLVWAEGEVGKGATFYFSLQGSGSGVRGREAGKPVKRDT